MTPSYSATGTTLAIAGLLVSIAAHFGINVTVDQIGAVIGLVLTLYGVIHQHYTNKNLAIATGVLPPNQQ